MDTSVASPVPLSTDGDTLEIVESVAASLDPFSNQTADALNEGCFCITLSRDALRRALASTVGTPDLFAMIEQHCPYVFSTHPVFISDAHVRQIRQLVEAVESVAALPAYREAVLAGAPDIARHEPGGARGVFFGYDFHLHAQGISLIEINTNAGGAMLNAALAKAQRACCAPVENAMPALDAAGLESSIVAMFRAEWAQSGRTQPLRTIAIVDDDPARQYLYPEFLLFQQLFERHGLQAVIADPRELTLCGGVLWHEQTPIDLVYNRLTDFMLSAPACAALRAAYLDRSAVVTPHPQAHALYADKRNLAILTDPQRLTDFGVPQATQEILLASIPHTEVVDAAHAERLWAARRKLFFKPTAGYGGRAAYRGDKVTKRVWEEILSGDYVAQDFITPSERTTTPDTGTQRLKFDIRAYAYNGATQWLAARLYQGQTTNFRTPGGGFAPVYRLPASDNGK